MDINEEEKMLNSHYHEEVKEEQQDAAVSGTGKKGGFITMPFILANEAFERVASFGLTPNLIVYLMDVYKMSVSSAQNLIYVWNITNSFTPFVGAILADSLLGHFRTIGIGSIFSLVGMFVFWMTTITPQAKPSPCDALANNCKSPTIGQYTFLIFGFILMSIGTGGIRPCSQAFGVDQIMDQGGQLYRCYIRLWFCIGLILYTCFVKI